MVEHTDPQSNPSYLRPPVGIPLATPIGGSDPLGSFIANSAFGPYQAGRTSRRSTTIGSRQRPRHRSAPVHSQGHAGWHIKTFYIPDGMEIVAGSTRVVEVPFECALLIVSYLASSWLCVLPIGQFVSMSVTRNRNVLHSIQLLHVHFAQTLVTSVRTTMISLRRPPNLRLGDHYSLGPFGEGTGQRAIAEKAAQMYDQPELAQKGGFFYHLYNSKEWVGVVP